MFGARNFFLTAARAVGDSLWNYVTALFSTTSTNGAQNNTFLDSSTNNFTITRNGNTTQGSFSPYEPNGYWSNADFSNSNFLTCNPGAGAAFGTGDFTVEAWAFATAALSGGDNPYICDTRAGGGAWLFSWNPTGGSNPWQLAWYNGSTLQPSVTMPLNTWNHCAYVRSGTTGTLYLNGISIGSWTDNFNYSASVTTLHIGRRFTINGGTAQYFPGYLSNFRIVKGTAVYTTNFTPPTAPLTAITNTVLLTCQSNRFIDNSTNAFAITANGSPSVQAFSPLGNTTPYSTAAVGGSGYFDGSGDYLTLAPGAAFAFGTGDFTVEAWIYPTAAPGGSGSLYIIDARNAGQTGTWAFLTNGDGTGSTLRLDWYTGAVIIVGNTNLIVGTWNHCVYVRSGTTYGLFINGTRTLTGTDSTNYTVSPTTSYVGSRFSADNALTGYMASVRVVKGTAVYSPSSSTLTVPTSPLTAVTNTVLLLNATNAGIFDAAAVNDFETVGNAQVSTTQAKFGPTSMSFNGTNSNLFGSSSQSVNLTTGNWTLEAWVYCSSLAANQTIVCVHGGSFGINWWLNTSGQMVVDDGATGQSAFTGGAVAANTWTHVALSRYGTTTAGFINGNFVGSNSFTPQSCSIVLVGRFTSGTTPQWFNGYIDDLRITKGYARYWYNFPVPTSAFPVQYAPEVIPPSDPLFDYVTMLLPGNGTNGAQNNTFLDSSTNNFTITRNGNTTQGTFTPYGANWSNYFKSGDYLGFNSNSAFNMNTYCCLEAWVCYTSLSSSTLVVGRDSSYWIGYDFAGIGGAASKFVFSIYNTGASWQAVSSTTSPVVGVWYHVVGIKDNTTLRIYINGVQENTATFSGTAVTTSNVVQIAANQGTQPMVGYISNTRLVLGASASVLPYTGNFTPPTAPLTAVSGTAFLTCQSNRFVDNSSNAFSVIVNNTPSVQRFSPFNPTTPYAAGTIGGSGYFDGTGDYLTAPDNAAFDMGNGDFTVEFWFNATQSKNTSFFTKRAVNSSYSPIMVQWTSGNQLIAYCSVTGSSWGMASTTSATYPLNTWNHVAFVRYSNNLYLYVNGVSAVTPVAITSAVMTNTSAFVVGADDAAGNLGYAGYISNLRVVKGTAVYTAAFTPPTAPVTAITNTSLLTNFTNGGIIDNAMMNDLETVGNAQISTSVSKFGGGSLAFDGNGDGLLGQVSNLFDFGSGNFTVEFWANCVSTSGFGFFASVWENSGGSDANSSWLIRLDNGTILTHFMQGGGTYNTLTSPSISTNTWFHFAWVRSGNTQTMYINGLPVASGSLSGAMNTAIRSLRVGYQGAATNYLNGYIDDLRITKGIARYVQPFTPPTQAFQTQ